MRRALNWGWIPILLVAWAVIAGAGTFSTGEVAVVTAKGRFVITVELAQTPSQRSQGLQGRRELGAGTGMLFDFLRPQRVAMWMKNTPLPLDMLFIGDDGRVVNIAQGTVPFSLKTIASDGPVRWVLELNAGAVTRMGIELGNRVTRIR